MDSLDALRRWELRAAKPARLLLGLVLLVAMASKIYDELAGAVPAEKLDPDFGLPLRVLVWMSIALDGMALMALGWRNRWSGLALAWVGGIFLCYHLGPLVEAGKFVPCPCLGLGWLTTRLGAQWQQTLGLLSSAAMLWLGLREISPATGAKPSPWADTGEAGPHPAPSDPSGETAERPFRARLWTALVLAAAAAALMAYRVPLSTGIQFGGDEHFEQMKASLVVRGYALYREIWSDQPRLFTQVLAWCLRLSPESATAGRVVCTLVSCLGVAALAGLAGSRRAATGVLTVLFWLSSPTVLVLAVSTMQEMPMISLSLGGALLLSRALRRGSLPGAVFGGLLFAAAIEIKLTAVLWAAAYGASAWIEAGRERRRAAFKLLVAGGVAATAAVLAYEASCGGVPLRSILGTHFSVVAPGQDGGPDAQHFGWNLAAQQRELYWAAGVGVVALLVSGGWRKAAFPLTLMAVQAAFSAFYRPWWPFYYADLAVPLAWLAAIGIVELAVFLAAQIRGGMRFQPMRWGPALVCALLVTLPSLAYAPARLHKFWLQNTQVESAADNGWVQILSEWKPYIKWAYCRPQPLAFHAGLIPPPELAVLSSKRYWSGQISTEEVARILSVRNVELLLLLDAPCSPAFQSLLARDYHLAKRMGGYVLYLGNSVKDRNGRPLRSAGASPTEPLIGLARGPALP